MRCRALPPRSTAISPRLPMVAQLQTARHGLQGGSAECAGVPYCARAPRCRWRGGRGGAQHRPGPGEAFDTGRRCDRLLLPAPGERSMISRRNVVLSLAALPAWLQVDWRGLGTVLSGAPGPLCRALPAGGSTDVGARLIAEHLSRSLHQQFLRREPIGRERNARRRCGREERAGRINILVSTDAVASNPSCVQSEFRSVA